MHPVRPSSQPGWHIRRATLADRAFAEEVASRLLVGTAPWRDRDALLATFRGWLLDGLAASDAGRDDHAAYIAETAAGVPVGIVTVSASQHFSGEAQAEVGELAVIAEVAGQGVGSALLRATEDWARAHGYRFLSLATGAANSRARAFYARHGFAEEDVRQTKPL